MKCPRTWEAVAGTATGKLITALGEREGKIIPWLAQLEPVADFATRRDFLAHLWAHLDGDHDGVEERLEKLKFYGNELF